MSYQEYSWKVATGPKNHVDTMAIQQLAHVTWVLS